MHNAIKAGAADCQSLIHFEGEAVAVFETEAVRRRLMKMIEFIVKILQLISRYYSKGYLSKSARH